MAVEGWRVMEYMNMDEVAAMMGEPAVAEVCG